MSDRAAALVHEKAVLEAEIAELETSRRFLAAAIGELAHDGRRLTDALERMGGQAAGIEGRRQALRENRAMSETELVAIETRLAEARRRLGDIEAELEQFRAPPN